MKNQTCFEYKEGEVNLWPLKILYIYNNKSKQFSGFLDNLVYLRIWLKTD